ncbi:MAG TPA: hypothetical protein PLC98_04600 [Anaerolineales bacterium]|nr:hypothetical protein [Anaerolineales bacterium]
MRLADHPRHALSPRFVTVIVEQPRDQPRRLRFDAADDTFHPTTDRSLLFERGFSGAYGWIAGSGAPPDPHWDVLLCTCLNLPAGVVVDADLCGVFVRGDGDHKFVALGRDLADVGVVADLDEFPHDLGRRLKMLYPRVDPGEGWHGAAYARALVQTAPTSRSE